ncbi:hypothetical protein VC83_05693 [Pseudogymnoascus destructans]|uniref:High-affinity Zn(2+) transporter zrt1 n=2 Tax=Pseudogymnoascus destructans TaxID=655981 RepID=L8FYR7_PSED2|nr:uncharacterized protein VC83_05693 [Pseudogymnoascus destructans]ELR05684.1 hypothetical protein GMDG_07527 [Pseudogymnoascus destructans 20631-21]OAF57683.1 hypothetical protein VC83_05693 [Pseudogymnoascus destructans]
MSDAAPVPQCSSGNDYDGRMGLRISSIFVILFGSMMGALFPVLAARSKCLKIPKSAFFVAKYFGSGVIIATAFIHLLAPAHDALTNECLTGPITKYSWVEGIVLMTIFVMFFVELMTMRFDFFGSNKPGAKSRAQDPEGARPPAIPITAVPTNHSSDLKPPTPDPAAAVMPALNSSSSSQTQKHDADPNAASQPFPTRSQEFSYPTGGTDNLSHGQHHSSEEHIAAQLTSIFILEFGVVFHSIFIGLTLAVAGQEFVVLYIVLVFHQTFEGLGLGSRLATTPWSADKEWLPWLLGALYGISTPLSIAVGLGVRKSLSTNGRAMLLVNGIFDSISAGILIYTGLVELMANEFMFNQEMRGSSLKVVLAAFGCMVIGAGLMAVLGKWA